MKRPNFLYIMTDQHRADWLGCYGHPVVKTPNIDALAAKGARFADFHVASPVCMPNRGAFMTGRYPTTNGLRYNGCVLPEGTHTFVDVLRAAGYQTASIGKSHLEPMTHGNPHDWHDPDDRLIAQAQAPRKTPAVSEAPESYAGEADFDVPKPYYGFDKAYIVTGHGATARGHYLQWFKRKHPDDWEALRDPKNQLPHNYTCPQAIRTPVAEEDYATSYIRDRAIAHLKDSANDPRPKFTYVSFPDPHHPFTPPGRYWDMYSPDQFDIPVPYASHQNPPPPLAACKDAFDRGDEPEKATNAIMVSDDHVREAMALSAGMITMIDDAIGDILKVLEETGQADNTVIIFNSDHGDYLGDYNLLLKGPWMHSSVTHVPMIWAEPDGQGGQVIDTLASTIDMAATILDRAGVAPYVGMQGVSLLSAMTGAEATRDALLVEYNDGFARMGFDLPTRVRSVMTADWRLALHRDEEWGELYDRRNDPTQSHNLWDVPEYAAIKSEMLERLAHLLISQMDESPRALRSA